MDPDEAETVRLMLDSLEKFRAGVDARKNDEEGFPEGFLQEVASLGLMGLAVPQEHGGLGLSATGYVRVIQETPTIDGALAVMLGAHQSIGFKALTLFGTAEQKAKYYPRLASGEQIAAFALTEPGSGSDAGSIRTRATLSEDGRHYILNGEKIWITNGGIASFLTVFAKTEDDKVTAFIVELPTDGISFGPPEDKMGIRASSTTSVYFENARVPVENILGGKGKGFKIAMEVLNNGRLGLAGGSVGAAKMMIKKAVEHASGRTQFGKPIADFGMIQKKIGQMVVDTFVAESMIYMTTSLIDRKQFDYSLESAMAKIFSTESLWRVVNETLQIHGGMGYMKECGIERMLRDCRINLIFEGTNEILRLFVALAGLQGPGEELAEVAKAIREPVKQIGVLTGFAAKRVKLNVMGGASLSQAHPALKRQAALFEDYTAEFALQCAKLLQRHGRHITERQFACKRVADIAIDLFAMACVISRVTTYLNARGIDSCAEELAIARSFFVRANRRIRGNFKSIDRNDDDEIKLIARRSCEAGAYKWDII
jgi:acyl-CoA dehydrogenase family protein 9